MDVYANTEDVEQALYDRPWPPESDLVGPCCAWPEDAVARELRWLREDKAALQAEVLSLRQHVRTLERTVDFDETLFVKIEAEGKHKGHAFAHRTQRGRR